MSLSISPDLERQIAEQARAAGFESAEAYLATIVEHVATHRIIVSDAEFFQLLESLASDADLPTLPSDFSRADIYLDHD